MQAGTTPCWRIQACCSKVTIAALTTFIPTLLAHYIFIYAASARCWSAQPVIFVFQSFWTKTLTTGHHRFDMLAGPTVSQDVLLTPRSQFLLTMRFIYYHIKSIFQLDAFLSCLIQLNYQTNWPVKNCIITITIIITTVCVAAAELNGKPPTLVDCCN